MYINNCCLITETQHEQLFTDEFLPTPYWTGFIRSMGKCLTKTPTYTTDDTIYVWCTLMPKSGEWGWIGIPMGRWPYQWDKIVCAPHLYHGEGGWPIYGGNGGTRLSEVEWLGVLQNLIPNVGQLVFPQVPVKGWVIYMDKHGLLDGPGDTMCLPVHNSEAIHGVFFFISVSIVLPLGSALPPFLAPVYIIHKWHHLW